MEQRQLYVLRRSQLWRTLLMRAVMFLVAVTLVACTTARPGMAPVVPQNTGESALAFRLAPGTSVYGPVLQVTIENRTRGPLCVRADALRNPRSGEMRLYLRDARGRELRWQDSGFIPPPIEGVVKIEPASSVEGFHYLRGRFVGTDGMAQLPQGWHARVAVRYGPCEDPFSYWAASGWQPI